MLKKWLYIIPEFIRVGRQGTYTGDLAILKSSLGTFKPSPAIAAHLDTLEKATPDFSDIDFAKMSKGSLGREYARFLEKNGLKPFRFSGNYRELMLANYLVVLYTSVHDIVHVLTGYNTSLAGEAGVWGFMAGQDISPNAYTAHRMTKILFPIIHPRKTGLIHRAAQEGFQNGQAANPLLTIDFRNAFEKQVTELREIYRIQPSQIPEVQWHLIT